MDPFGRKLFDNFDPSSVSKFTEKKLLSLKASGGTLLSEPKLRAVIENAKQMLKVNPMVIKLVSKFQFQPCFVMHSKCSSHG